MKEGDERVRLSVVNVVLIVTLVFGAAVGSAYLIYRTFTADLVVADAAESSVTTTLPSTMGPTVPLGSFIVNLAEGNRYLRSEIVIELTEQQSAKEIKERMPQVRDSVIGVLRQFSVEELSSPEGDRSIKQEIIDALSPILSRGRVSGVYFTSWVIQ